MFVLSRDFQNELIIQVGEKPVLHSSLRAYFFRESQNLAY